MGVMCSFRALQLLMRLGHLPPGHWLDRLQNRYDTPERSLANSYSWTLVLGGRFRLPLFCDAPKSKKGKIAHHPLLATQIDATRRAVFLTPLGSVEP